MQFINNETKEIKSFQQVKEEHKAIFQKFSIKLEEFINEFYTIDPQDE